MLMTLNNLRNFHRSGKKSVLCQYLNKLIGFKWVNRKVSLTLI